MEIIARFKRSLTHSLVRNAVFMIASTAVMSVAGFLFWIIVARSYTPQQVGIATALISVGSLIMAASMLGLDNGLLRFLGSANNKHARINAALGLVTVSSVLISAVFLLLTPLLSPHLAFVRDNLWYCLGFTAVVLLTSVSTIVDSVYTAYRSAHFILFKNIAYSLAKLTAPLALVSLGAFGIFMANGVALIAALLLGGWLLYKKFDYLPRPHVRIAEVRDMAKFTGVSYAAGLSSNLTSSLLPIIILNGLGPVHTAYYYLATMIAMLLNVIPKATSQSLLAEGAVAHAGLRDITRKAAKTTFTLLIPAVLVIVLAGQYLLLAFGKEYSTESLQLLQLLAVASIFGAINYIGDALLHIQKRVGLFLIMNTLNTGMILLGCVLFVRHGLVAVGVAWLVSQVLTSLLYLGIFRNSLRNKRLTAEDYHATV